MELNKTQINLIYGILIFVCFMPFVSPAIALVLGLILSFIGIKHEAMHKRISFSLQAAIVLMGFGMNLSQVISASVTGFVDTAISVTVVMTLGIILAKLLKIESKTAVLISAGTAICGGSAIAAVSPIINAKNYQISFSLIVIFTLNAIALVIFPMIGHSLGLSQTIFGQWAAIAIHDTSSVVGAGATYGEEALQLATTVKLIRALWIIPLSLVIALVQKNKSTGKIKIPYFIFLFVVSIIIAYLFPSMHQTYEHFYWLGKRIMVVALFLIGSNMSIKEAKKAGAKSFIFGIILWLIIATMSLYVLTA